MNIDTLCFVAEQGGQRFEIIEGCGEGVYLLRYAGLHDSGSTHDYLQDTVVLAMECAKERFGVASSAWRAALPEEQPAYRRAPQS